MTDDELINKILQGLCNNTSARGFAELCNETIGQEHQQNFGRLFGLMRNLIEPVNKDKSFGLHTALRISTKGQEIYKQGGWMAHLEQLKNTEAQKQEMERLQRDNLQLSNESFTHQQTIRDQEQRIRDLQEELSGLDIYRHYWVWLLTGLLLLGYLIGAGSEQKLHLLQNLLGLQ